MKLSEALAKINESFDLYNRVKKLENIRFVKLVPNSKHNKRLLVRCLKEQK